MSAYPIQLAPIRAAKSRCAWLRLSHNRTRAAIRAAIAAMAAGHSASRAYADACASIRKGE